MERIDVIVPEIGNSRLVQIVANIMPSVIKSLEYVPDYFSIFTVLIGCFTGPEIFLALHLPLAS